MSFFSINPLTLRNVNLSDPNAARKFQGDLSQILYELTQIISTPASLASVLNGNAQLQSSALNHVNVTVINGSTDCTGAAIVTGSLAWSAASTMTLNNLGDGTILDFRLTGSASAVLKIAANKPAGGAYFVGVLTGLAGPEVDMTATGFAAGAGTTPIYLRGIAQLAAGVLALGYT